MELTDEFSVRLTAAEWNQLTAILAEGPFRIVAPLLAKIRDQAQAQDRAAQDRAAQDAAQHPPPPPAHPGNGDARDAR